MNLDVTKFSSKNNLKTILSETYGIENEWQQAFINEYSQARSNFNKEINIAMDSKGFDYATRMEIKSLSL